MSKLIDLTGRKFGRLSVICRYDVNDKLGRAFWKCQCDCGKFSTALGYNLRTGHTTSCVRSTAYNLDRKDSIKGYTKENCVVCCKRCNRAKSNLFSYEEWLEIGKFIQEHPENFKRLQ